MRLLEDQVEKLTGESDVRRQQQIDHVQLPAAEPVPDHIKFAAGFVSVFQQTTQPNGQSCYEEVDFASRYVHDSELGALASACELLEDYFDRHNSRVLRERQRAPAINQETKRRGKRTALPVTREDDDGQQ